MIDTSIVIPAYKPVELLKTCVQSIMDTADLNKIEIVVVCNGSDKESGEYVLSLQNSACIRLVWYTEALGFTKAANIGLRLAKGPYCILMNTDVKMLNFKERHFWVDKMVNPMRENKNVAVTGAADMYFLHRLYFPFFCVGLNKAMLEKFNYLDEIFSPGYGEDIDFCFKSTLAGHELVLINNRIADDENKRYTSDFPIYHQGRASFKEQGAGLAERGGEIIYRRYAIKPLE